MDELAKEGLRSLAAMCGELGSTAPVEACVRDMSLALVAFERATLFEACRLGLWTFGLMLVVYMFARLFGRFGAPPADVK